MKYQNKFEQAEYEACMDHWDRMLEEAEKSDCLYQQVYRLIPQFVRIGKTKSEVLDLIYEHTSADNLCPGEDPATLYIRNGHTTISVLCDVDVELRHDELGYEEHNSPDPSWESEDNGSFYKHIQCYRVCMPLGQFRKEN